MPTVLFSVFSSGRFGYLPKSYQFEYFQLKKKKKHNKKAVIQLGDLGSP